MVNPATASVIRSPVGLICSMLYGGYPSDDVFEARSSICSRWSKPKNNGEVNIRVVKAPSYERSERRDPDLAPRLDNILAPADRLARGRQGELRLPVDCRPPRR